jgi:hypothetical protein
MTLLLTGLLAGLLDAMAADLLYMAKGYKSIGKLFQYIASGVYGTAAFTGGAAMVCMGILFHFLIAMAWVAFYFFLHAHLPWLDAHPLMAAIGYGIMVWTIMTLVIVPNSMAAQRPFSWAFAVINMAILILTIGLPAAYLLR